jgi:hypothetical protein
MASIRSFFAIGAGFALCAASVPSAWAQAVDIPAIVTGAHGTNTWASVQYAHQFETDIDDTPAEMSRDSVQVVAGHRFRLSDDVYWVGNASYQGSYYDFSNGSGPAQLVWNDIHQGTLTLGVGWKAGERWTLVALALGRTAGESGADFDDTLTGGLGFAADYTWNENLSTGVILGVMSQLEDSAAVWPIPTVDWRFAEGWRFQFGIVEMAYPGVGPLLSYRTDSWMFAVGGCYQKRRYRLDDDRVGPINEGIGQEQSFPVFARVAYLPTAKTNLGFTIGTALGGEIRSEQNGGSRIFDKDYDPALILGLQANIRF